MPYEFNPLLPDGFQKKSPVSPSDIQQLQSDISELQESSENLKLKKVTKFFSATDSLEDNEIAQYQGEDDAINNLKKGFFYQVAVSESIVEKEIVTYNPYYYANINTVFPSVGTAKVYNDDSPVTPFGNYSIVTFIINGDNSETFDVFLIPVSDNIFNSEIVINSDDVTDFELEGTGFYYVSGYALCTTGARQWQRFPISIDSNYNVVIDNSIASPVGWNKNIKDTFTFDFADYNSKVYPTLSIHKDYHLIFLRPLTYPIPIDSYVIVADYKEGGVSSYPHEVLSPLSVQTFNFENINSFTPDTAIVQNLGGVARILSLTQAEYNAITTKDVNTMYVITD